MAKIVVRTATVNDADTISQLWQALVKYHTEIDPDLPPEASNGARRYARRVLERIDDPLTRIFVAEVDGNIAGYVLGVVVDLVPDMFAQEPSGFLADIYVSDTYRRAGVGAALVRALTDWFNSRGLKYFEWHVSARNTVGIAFWHAINGREVMLRMRAELPTVLQENDNAE